MKVGVSAQYLSRANGGVAEAVRLSVAALQHSGNILGNILGSIPGLLPARRISRCLRRMMRSSGKTARNLAPFPSTLPRLTGRRAMVLRRA